jgi:hypothetical protein
VARQGVQCLELMQIHGGDDTGRVLSEY